MPEIVFESESLEQTVALGERLGQNLKGGEVFELQSDLGGGKTTFVRGLAKGFGSPDPVASPSFTISYVYSRPDKKQLHHFDFYRLQDPGVVAAELAEVEGDTDVVVAVEWSEIVKDILPDSRVVVGIKASSDTARKITFQYPDSLAYLFSGVVGVCLWLVLY